MTDYGLVRREPRIRGSGPGRASRWLQLWLIASGLPLLLPGLVEAQLFSPGKLIAAHAPWEGLGQCNVCHSGGDRIDDAKCLACHAPLARRIRERKGYHGLGGRGVDCERCHTDHKGPDRQTVVWPGGSRERFPHAETGWPLKGKHVGLRCDQCHAARQLAASDVRAWVTRYGKAETYLGVSGLCIGCHFDEHRRELGNDCARCHHAEQWKPAPGFDHRKSYPLEGAHARAACTACHKPQTDPAYQAAAFPRPRAATFLHLRPIPHGRCTNCHTDPHANRLGERCLECHGHETWKIPPRTWTRVEFHDRTGYPLQGRHRTTSCEGCHPRDAQGRQKLRPIPHGACTDCHKDVHAGRFGSDCRSCHSFDNWRVDPAATERLAFHDQTAYPLRGQHRVVPCDDCHPRDARGARKLKPIPFGQCRDCHFAAHPELLREPGDQQQCERCHNLNAFVPSSYTALEHHQSRYGLRGAHGAVACPLCHLDRLGPPEPPVQPPPGLLSRKATVSRWRLRVPAGFRTDECTTCHRTPHRDQFPGKPCTACHTMESWSTQGQFDHDRQTRYPLVGSHRTVACGLCHPGEQDANGPFVRYRPVSSECAACHADPHVGQFQLLAPQLGCEACHDQERFKPAPGFRHERSDRSDFPLRGRHAQATCEQCHPALSLPGGVRAVRYRPTVKACDQCHTDPHRGTYATYAPLPDDAGFEAEWTSSGAAPQPAAPGTRSTAAGRTDCGACHHESNWADARFDHDRTGFPLRGLHVEVLCNQCHTAQPGRSLPTDCAGCHIDAHGGRLGRSCRDCHDEEGYVELARAQRQHDRTALPLVGRHAALPCTECHPDVRELGFQDAPTTCEGCHRRELPRGVAQTLDHSPPAFAIGCERCHTALDWTYAYYADHERCFPIARSEHRGIGCRECHARGVPAQVERCTSGTANCIQCHGCGGHRGVLGFECKDPKCFRCHTRGE